MNQRGGDASDVTVAGLPSALREAHEILASGAAQILPENGLAERPDEILDRRLATGEIDVDTYDALRGKLHDAHPGRV